MSRAQELYIFSWAGLLYDSNKVHLHFFYRKAGFINSYCQQIDSQFHFLYFTIWFLKFEEWIWNVFRFLIFLRGKGPSGYLPHILYILSSPFLPPSTTERILRAKALVVVSSEISEFHICTYGKYQVLLTSADTYKLLVNMCCYSIWYVCVWAF